MSSESNGGGEGARTKTRNRSPNHPMVSLRRAVDLATELHGEYGTHKIPVGSVHLKWKYKEHSGKGNQCVAALKAYGLISTHGQGRDRKIEVTSAADRIIRGAPDRPDLLKQAAVEPPIHAELLEEYSAKGLPPDDILRTYLVWEREEGQFNEDVVDGFIERFRETLEFSGLDNDDIIRNTEGLKEDENRSEDSTTGDQLSNKEEEQNVSAAAPPKREGQVTVRDFPIPLISGGVAVLKVPVPMSDADFAQIAGTLKAWKMALVEHGESTSPESDEPDEPNDDSGL